MGLKYVVDDEQFYVQVTATYHDGRTDIQRLGPYAKVSAAKGAATRHEGDLNDQNIGQWDNAKARYMPAPPIDFERRFFMAEIDWKEIQV